MSVTTTANPQTHFLHTILADYDLHHSEITEHNDTSLNEHASPLTSSRDVMQNPPHWPNDHRRIPGFRPVNRELNQSQRRVYLSSIERAFVTVMFTGVLVEAVSSIECRILYQNILSLSRVQQNCGDIH